MGLRKVHAFYFKGLCSLKNPYQTFTLELSSMFIFQATVIFSVIFSEILFWPEIKFHVVYISYDYKGVFLSEGSSRIKPVIQ